MTKRSFIKIQPWSMKWEKLSQYSESLKDNECVDIIRTCTQNSIFSQLAWSCPKTWLTTTVGTYYNSFALLHPGVSRDSHFAESSSCTALFYGALTFGPPRLGAATHLFGFKAVLYPSDREIQAGWQQSFQEMNKKNGVLGPCRPWKKSKLMVDLPVDIFIF